MTDTDKIYSVLIVADYSNANSNVRYFIDTITNNLKGITFTEECTGKWKPLHMMEHIRISLIDVIESIDSAKNALTNGSYDVVICDNHVNGKSIGSGTLEGLRNLNPKAIFVLLLNPYQKKGIRNPQKNTLCDGKKVQSLFDKGFYNAIYKDQLNLDLLAKMIKTGGFPKEWAYINYGLGVGETAFLEGSVSTPDNSQPTVSVQPVQPVESVRPSTQTPNITHNTPAEKNSKKRFHDPFNKDTKKENLSSDKDIVPSITEPTLPVSDISYPSDMATPDPTGYNPTIYSNTKKSVSVEELPYVAKANASLMGSFNATVSFAQDKTIILKLDEPLSEKGIPITDIVGMPVVIPFLRKTAQNLKNKEDLC